MIRSLVPPAALLLLHASLGAKPCRLAFERGSGIWVADLYGTGGKKLTRGSQHNTSSNGAREAFDADTGDSKCSGRNGRL